MSVVIQGEYLHCAEFWPPSGPAGKGPPIRFVGTPSGGGTAATGVAGGGVFRVLEREQERGRNGQLTRGRRFPYNIFILKVLLTNGKLDYRYRAEEGGGGRGFSTGHRVHSTSKPHAGCVRYSCARPRTPHTIVRP
jgi:hypothetical protein